MDVTNLRVYQESLNVIHLIEEITQNLPSTLFDVEKQILRSSRSISALIAEGHGRKRSQKEFRRFIVDAMASSDETISHLRVIALSKFNNISLDQLTIAASKYKSLSKQLNSLAKSIVKNMSD